MTLTPDPQLYVQTALSYIPHIIQLVDKNPYSPTYGCFDREYWHYRTLDFPCGMSQEMVLPLAMLWARDYPGNKYYQWERLRELATAGLHYTIKGSHADGTCDDYFPFEQAMGALVFSTYAGTEAYQLLGLKDEALLQFYCKRGDHLAQVNETGRLSNHQAFAALAAYNIFKCTGVEKYRQLALERTKLALSWQHPEEGWFQEYEGADPGYHTCSIAFFAKLLKKAQAGGDTQLEKLLIDPLVKAVEFSWHFMHPDGSYTGEYGSRNTFHFYPHGFEVMAPYTEKAAQVADQYLRSLASGKRYFNEDDRMCCHLVYDWLHAWEDRGERAAAAPINERPDFLKWMPAAGFAVAKSGGYYAVANLRKGGVFKAFNEDHCIASDTAPIAQLEDGRTIVTHLMDEEHKVSADPAARTFSVEGVFSVRQRKLSSPLKLIIFRIINLTASRYFPNLIRSLIQKLLITGKNRTDYRFRRTLRFGEQGFEVTDEFPDAIPATRLSVGSDATSIYVANSNVFQESTVRIPWQHASQELLTQVRQGGASWTRQVGSGVSSLTEAEPPQA